MWVATPRELGAVVRGRRLRIGWTQRELADRVGTSRQWVVALEGGKARAELGLVLAAIGVLGLGVDLFELRREAEAPASGSVDLDAVLASVRRDP
jgi:HTH-type transcriptional regulator/antitoxin HipB